MPQTNDLEERLRKSPVASGIEIEEESRREEKLDTEVPLRENPFLSSHWPSQMLEKTGWEMQESHYGLGFLQTWETFTFLQTQSDSKALSSNV